MEDKKESLVVLRNVSFFERAEIRNHASFNNSITVFGKGTDRNGKTVELSIRDEDMDAGKIVYDKKGEMARDNNGKPLREKRGNVSEILNRKYVVETEEGFKGVGDLYIEHVQKVARNRAMQIHR